LDYEELELISTCLKGENADSNKTLSKQEPVVSDMLTE
jgi:hypothetical protein